MVFNSMSGSLVVLSNVLTSAFLYSRGVNGSGALTPECLFRVSFVTEIISLTALVLIAGARHSVVHTEPGPGRDQLQPPAGVSVVSKLGQLLLHIRTGPVPAREREHYYWTW